MSQPGNTTVRRAAADDQRFIASTWWRNMLGDQRAPRVRRRLNAQIDRVLDDSSTRALVAVNEQDRILGWIVYATTPSMRVVHYVYVRDEHRGSGIARRLIDAAWPGSDARLVMTMIGPDTKSFIARKGNAVFCRVEEFFR